MNKYFARLAALISASLSSTPDAAVVPKDVESEIKDAPQAVSLLNERVSPELLQHRSHASHSSHGSHRSSSGGYRPPVTTPAPSPPRAREPVRSPPKQEAPIEQPPARSSDPLGQEPRPAQSIPDAKQPRSVGSLDPVALKNIVMRMQLALQFEGYYQGTIDGAMGPTTREAVKRFKRAKSIPGDTVFDTQTLNALGILGF